MSMDSHIHYAENAITAGAGGDGANSTRQEPLQFSNEKPRTTIDNEMEVSDDRDIKRKQASLDVHLSCLYPH